MTTKPKPNPEPAMRLSLKEIYFAAGLIDLVAGEIVEADLEAGDAFNDLSAADQDRYRRMAVAAVEALIPQVR